MKTQKIIKNQKPIEIDCHIKYVCPDHKCNQFHWLSLAESRTKNFIVVCGCGLSFKVKQIDKIKLKYKKHKDHTKNKPVANKTAPDSLEIEELPVPDQNDFDEKMFIDDCVSSLVAFGFSQKEATNLLTQSYHKHSTRNHTELIKQTLLDTFGEKNHDI